MKKASKLMPYDFMVKHLPQEAWIKGKGVFLWLAFFFSEIGAGIYLISLILGFQQGLLLGYLVLLVVGGGIHVAYLGKPFRVALMFLKPGSSELARGMWIILLFAIFGAIQLAPIVFPGVSWSGDGTVLNIINGVLCFFIITHGFMTMSMVQALPVWNSSMMIPLSLFSGLFTGSQIILFGIYLTTGDIGHAELWARWTLIGFAFSFGIFLFSGLHSSENAKASLMTLIKGEKSMLFYVGIVLVGLIIPLLITLKFWVGGAEQIGGGLIFLRLVCVICGDLLVRYGIMWSARYTPLV